MIACRFLFLCYREISSLTLEEKFHIYARPCIVLFVPNSYILIHQANLFPMAGFQSFESGCHRSEHAGCRGKIIHGSDSRSSGLSLISGRSLRLCFRIRHFASTTPEIWRTNQQYQSGSADYLRWNNTDSMTGNSTWLSLGAT